MKWFLVSEQRPAARLRCVCFPWAGAGAAAYREWHTHLPKEIEVCAIQLPGRGWRVREAPAADLDRIAEDATTAVEELGDLPLVLFGHSFGAWLALLVARRLEAAGRSPVALVASGRRAPSHARRDAPMRHLDDDGFVEEIQRRYGAINEEIVADRDLLRLLLPALRADVAALEGYEHVGTPRVDCPLVAVGGSRDPVVPVAELSSWSAETNGPFDVRTFQGGHFYLQDDPGPLLRWLRNEIGTNWVVGAGSG